MYWKYAILLFLIPWYCDAKFTSFIASFQSLGHWSKNEYLEYTDNLPELKEFSVCHWEKTQFFSKELNTIWAYCHQNSENGKKDIKCFYFFSFVIFFIVYVRQSVLNH